MQASVMRNTKPLDGATSVEIAGRTATVEVEVGSELDGFLYYQATRDGRPRLTLKTGGDESFSRRFIVVNTGGAVYSLTSETDLQT